MISSEIFYLLLVVVGIIIAVKIISAEHIFDISSPAGWFLLSIIVAYFIRPVIFFINNDWLEWNKMGLPAFDEIGIKYGLVIFLCVIAFAVGYGCTKKMNTYARAKKEMILPQARKLIYIVLIIFALLGYISALKYRPVPTIGEGISMEKAYTGSSVYKEVSGYYVNAVFLVPACGLLYYATSGKLLNTILLTAPFVLLQLYFGWGRSHFLLFFVALLGIAGLKTRFSRGTYSHVTVLILVIAILLPILAALGHNRALLREGSSRREITYQIEKAQGRWTSSEASDLLGFTNSAFYLYYSGKTFPHAFCYPYLYTILVQPIPRVLRKDKPLPQEMDTQQGAPSGMAPGPIGDAYHQLGWLGPLIFLFHGWWTKRAAVFLANPGRPAFLASFGFLLCYPIYLPSFIWLPQLPFFLVPAVAVYLIERHFVYTSSASNDISPQEQSQVRWKNSIIGRTSPIIVPDNSTVTPG
jgi:hypothetical protein